MAAVDAAFVETGRGLSGWRDPHPDRMPLEEEYSRVTNPQRWKILAARAEAWFEALAAAGLAEIEAGSEVAWQEPPRITAARTIRAVPRAPGTIPLVVAMYRLDEAGGPAVVVGAGNPTIVVALAPDCACDACDSGSQGALDELDEYMLSVVTGAYRKLWRGRREITVYSEAHMGRSGFHRRRVSLGRFVGGRFTASPTAATKDLFTTKNYSTYQLKLRRLNTLRRAIAKKLGRGGSHDSEHKKLEKILARPRGWHQVHGSSWLEGNNQQ